MASRDHALDGLRGLAALSVAGGHSLLTITGLSLWSLTYADFSTQPLKAVAVRLGYIVAPSDAAVMLFFVLSGHVLWAMFERRYKGIESFSLAIAERLWRLLPVSIAAGLLFGAAVHINYIAPMDGPELWRTMFILSRSTNGVLWSLQVEIIASVLLFGIWVMTKGRAMPALLFAAPSLFAFWQTGSEYALYLPAFLLGAAIRYVPKRLARSPFTLIAGVPMLVAASVFLGHDWEARLFEMSGAFLMVAWARAVQPRWLLSRPVQFLGLVSYPFYLLHPIGVAFGFRNMPWVPMDQPAHRVVTLFVLSTLSTLALAYVVHRLVERPAMRVRLPDMVKVYRSIGEHQA